MNKHHKISLIVLFISFFILLPTHLFSNSRPVNVGIFPAPPLVFRDSGKPSGLFIDLIEYFSVQLGWDVEYVYNTWSESLNNLETAEIDLLPAIGHTVEREKKYDFTKHVIYVDSGVLFTSTKFQPRTVFELKGKRIAALKGSIFTKGFIDYISSFRIHCEILYTKDNREVMKAIVEGRADAGVCIYSLGNELAREYPVAVTVISFSPIALQFAVPKGKNADVIAGINNLMTEMIDNPDSLYHRSFKKWTLPSPKMEIPVWVWWLGTGLLSFGFILIVLNFVLRKQVNLKTKYLMNEITEKKRVVEELDREKEQLDVTLRSIEDGVITTDPDSNIVLINKAAERLTGFISSEAIGRPLSKVVNITEANTNKSYDNIIDEVLRTCESVEFSQANLVAKDGQNKIISYSCAPIKDKNEHIIGAILIFHDITASKHIEFQLQQAQKMEAMGTLAGGIAHDFNNILSSIIGYAELSVSEVEKGTPIYDFLQEVLAAGNRAKDLTMRILTISRHDEMEINPISLNIILKDTLKMLRATIPTSIDFKENISEEQLTVNADASQISQIIINLATNALHAMSENEGVLEVSLSQIKLGESTNNIYRDLAPGKYAVISVRDTGTGIKPEHIEKIFEPYFTTKEKGVGTGLGLSVIHGIVKSYNGHISVYSEIGKGTLFHIYLPIYENLFKVKEITTEEIPKGHERILFVDDEPSIVKMQEYNLRRLGYDVTSTTSSLEAFKIFLSSPDLFDVLISDMSMPKLTGDNLVNAVKQIRPDIPVILCTGFNEKIKENIKDSNINSYLLKPVDSFTMAKAIRNALDNKLKNKT